MSIPYPRAWPLKSVKRQERKVVNLVGLAAELKKRSVAEDLKVLAQIARSGK